jgi:hypothetical protein
LNSLFFYVFEDILYGFVHFQTSSNLILKQSGEYFMIAMLQKYLYRTDGSIFDNFASEKDECIVIQCKVN